MNGSGAVLDPDRWDGLGGDDARAVVDRQSRVLELIARAAPLADVLGGVLTSLEELIPGGRCSVLLLDRSRGTLHHGAAPSLPAGYVASIDGMRIGDGAGSCGTAAALDIPVVATDVRADPRWVDFRAAADVAGLRSCWSTPIEGRDGRPVGTFAVYHPRPHRPTRREHLLVERFTHLAAVAIEHAGLVGDLVASEERFRRTFDDNSLGMAILDPDRRITRSNAALTGLTGARADLVGSPLADVLTVRGGSSDALFADLDDDLPGPIVVEAGLHRRGRPDLAVEVTVSLLRSRHRRPAQYVVNVLDLTERHAAERERRARLEAETARRTAEELAHSRSALLAAVGHEARTPIQAIVGFAELLGTIDLDEARRRQALAHIDAAAGHVVDLLTDVLDLSRVEAHALPLHLETVRVGDVVAEVLGLLSAQADDRRVQLTHELADQVVRADPRRLRQVLLNLVGNAIRHGRHGGRVVVGSRPHPGGTDLLVTVADDGPGIPAAFLPLVFTPFARARSTTDAPAAAGTRREEGVGLGLGLAHGLVRAMSGDLTVGSSTSAGTCMVVRLPRADRPATSDPGRPGTGDTPEGPAR